MRLTLTATLLAFTGCASVTEGTSQAIAINTNPPGATCHLDRAGQQLGTIATTPGTITVKPKTEDNITVTCERPGYQQATFVNKSDTAAATFGNIIFGGLIGAYADRASGAAYKYDGVVTVPLTALPPSVPLPMAPIVLRGTPQS